MKVRVGALVLVGASLLVGCGEQAQPQTSDVPVTGGVVVPTGLATAPAGVPEVLDNGQVITPTVKPPAPTSGDIRQAAVEQATAATGLYCRRTVPESQWINELMPYLSITAANAYNGTDPANVPCTNVTGQGRYLPDSVDLLARVSLPTDYGVYLVLLSRDEHSTTWKVERFVPPESAGD